jgi:hypothetical protein
MTVSPVFKILTYIKITHIEQFEASKLKFEVPVAWSVHASKNILNNSICLTFTQGGPK